MCFSCQGLTIKPLVKWLKVPRSTSRKPTINEEIHERVSFLLLLLLPAHARSVPQLLQLAAWLRGMSARIQVNTTTKMMTEMFRKESCWVENVFRV